MEELKYTEKDMMWMNKFTAIYARDWELAETQEKKDEILEASKFKNILAKVLEWRNK